MTRTASVFQTFTAALLLFGTIGCGDDAAPEGDLFGFGPHYLAESAAAWPNALLDDGENLYFTDFFSSLVHRVSKNGGPASRLYGDAEESWRGTGLAIDANHLYAAFFEGSLVKLPRGGGEPVVLASGQRDVSSVAVHGSQLYWFVGYIPNVGGGPTIMTAGIDGGEPAVFASRQVGGASLLVHGDNLYWAANGAIMTAPAAGGEPVKLVADSLGQASAVTIHGGEIFWTARGTAAKAPLEGGVAELLEAAPDVRSDSEHIAVDDTFVYVSDSQARTVSRIPRAGGPAEVISPHDALGEGMVVDPDAVYYADGATESIVRLPK